MTPKPALEHQKPAVDEADVIDAEYEIDDTIDELEAKAGETGTKYIVRVWRIIPGEAEPAALCAITPAEFSMEYVREKFGPGKYNIWVYAGRRVARRWSGKVIDVPLDWEPPKKPSELEAEAKREDTHQIVAGIKELGELIFKMNEAQQARLEQSKPEPAPIVDPIAIQNSILAGMAQMKALFAPPETAPAPDSSRLMFEAFGKGMEVMKEVAGGGEASGIWDVLKTMAEPEGLLGKLTDIAQKQNETLTNPPALVDASGRPLPQAATGAPVQPTPEERRDMFMKMQLATLVQRAKANSDPALYAELILDTVSPEAAADFVGKPDAIEKLIEINPEVANHVEWFRAVGIHINEMLTETEPGQADSENVTTPTTEGDDVATVQDADRTTPRDSERPAGDTTNT